MNRLLLLLFCSLLALPRMGQGQTLTTQWAKAYGTAKNEMGGFTVAMPGGGYMVVGQRQEPFTYTGTYTPNRYLYFVRTNAQGDTLWTKYYRSGTDPQIRGLLVDNAGNLLITGSSNGRNAFITKLSPTITTLWSMPVVPTDPLISSTGAGYPVVMADGNYVVAYLQYGVVPNTFPQQYIYNQFLRKLDSNTGATIWDNAVSPYLANLGYSIYTVLSGLVAVPGGLMAFADGSKSLPTPQAKSVIMLLNSGGTVTKLKERTFNDPMIMPVPFSNGQNVFISRRQTITKLTLTGDTIWHTVVPPRYPGRKWDANSIKEDSQGNILVLGTSVFQVSGGSTPDYQVHLTRLRPTGQVLRDTMLYRSPDNYGNTLLLTPANEPVIGGYTSSGPYGDNDLFLLKLSAWRTVLATQPAAGPLAGAGLRCYPNPSAGGTQVRAVLPAPAGAGTRLRLYDALGRACAEVPVAAGAAEVAVPLAGLPPGLYLLRLRLPDGSSYTTRLLRE